MTWWHYLLLSNLYLILFYGFYVLLLQRETFFQLNRIYLVGGAVMSFLIPLVQLNWVKQWFITQKVQQTIYSAGPAVIYRIKVIQPQHITLGQVIGYIYVAGIVVLTIKLVWQLFMLNRILQNKQVAAAWSFFKKIKVDEQLESRKVIVAHEEVHARQWHSADVLLIEMIMILNWFNPVVYFYRRAIKHIHEFIADRDALKAGTSKADYAILLLSQTFNAPVHHLLNPFFNNSVLKQRIKMLQKKRSHYSALVKYGFSAPLFALMLALSSATINNSTMVKAIHKEAIQIFEAPATVLASTLAERIPVVTKEDLNRNTGNVEALTLYEGIKDLKTTEPVKDVLIRTYSNAMDTHNEVFTAVEKLPEFAGGLNKFYEFLSSNLHYPAEEVKNKTTGRVNVTFIIEKDGSLTDIKALNNPESAIAQEAVRVIAISPKWIAGEQNGKLVRVQYTVPVVFRLDDVGAAPDLSQPRHIKIQRVLIHTRKQADSGLVAPPAKMNVFRYNVNEMGADKLHLFIDGKEAPPGTSLASIDTKTIRSVSVFDNKTAARMYGDQFKEGVILIITLTTDKKP